MLLAVVRSPHAPGVASAAMTSVCPVCHDGPVVPATFPETFRLAGATFRWRLPARLCSRCGEWQLPAGARAQRDARALLALGSYGPLGPDAVRVALDLLALDDRALADLLGLPPDEVTRWREGHAPVPPAHGALVLALVSDALAGQTTTRDRLVAASGPRPLPDEITVDAPASMLDRPRSAHADPGSRLDPLGVYKDPDDLPPSGR